MIWKRALVTGASAGIGESFTRHLARRGTDVVVVARRADRLEALARELRPLGRHVEVLTADLAVAADRARVAERLRSTGEPIDLLVNNAGLGSGGKFVDAELAREQNMIAVNVDAVVTFTHAAARTMRAQGRGAIINVSSIAGNQPRGDLTVYGATKAFVTFFSQSVALELAGTGVTCTAVLPGLTHTEFHEVAGIDEGMPEWAWMSADDVAAQALDAAEKGRPLLIPGAVNKLYTLASTPHPGGVRRFAVQIGERVLGRVR